MAQNYRNLKDNATLVFRWLLIILTPIIALSYLALFFESQAGADATIRTFGDAVWWIIVTMSTLGYGNLVPVTTAGKIVGTIAILIGILFVAVMTATIVGKVVERVVTRIGKRVVGKLSDHILICGWNENGLRIITELIDQCNKSGETIVVLADRERAPDLPPNIIFVSGDSTRLDSLKKVAPSKAKVAVVLADQSSGTSDMDSRVILTTMALRRITEKNIRIICEVISAEDLEYLEGAGADEVIVRSSVAGDVISRTVRNPGTANLIRKLLTSSGDNQLDRSPIPKEFIGKTYGEYSSYVKSTMGFLPIALIRNDETSLNPVSEIRIREDDEVFIIRNQSCGR